MYQSLTDQRQQLTVIKKKLAKLLWLTGLSGSGKTTLANSVYKNLLKHNFKVLKIDGDIFRKKTKNINKNTRELRL